MSWTHVPHGYQTPSFPSLYLVITTNSGEAQYLYYVIDVWRFTLLWTLLIYGACHVAVSLYALVVQWRCWRIMWTVPLIYVLWGGLEAVMAGSIVGLM